MKLAGILRSTSASASVLAAIILAAAPSFAQSSPTDAVPPATPAPPIPLVVPAPAASSPPDDTPRTPAAWAPPAMARGPVAPATSLETSLATPRIDVLRVEMVKQTYGYQTVLADVASVGLLVLGVGLDEPAIAGAGAIGYFVGAPLVHVGHGRNKTAVASLGTRVLLPLTGAAIGAAAYKISEGKRSCDDCDDYGPVIGAALGGIVGLAVAPIIDAAVLARVDWLDNLQVKPAASFGPTGASITLGGTF